MSDCRNGGRSGYGRKGPVKGRLVYSDGTASEFSFSRYLNGKEREVACVEVDGGEFWPSQDVYETAMIGGKLTITAIVLAGGARFVRQGPRDWDDCEVE